MYWKRIQRRLLLNHASAEPPPALLFWVPFAFSFQSITFMFVHAPICRRPAVGCFSDRGLHWYASALTKGPSPFGGVPVCFFLVCEKFIWFVFIKPVSREGCVSKNNYICTHPRRVRSVKARCVDVLVKRAADAIWCGCAV